MTMAALAIRFAVELAGVAVLAYWGWQTGPEGIGRIVLVVGAPLVLIVIWSVVVAPSAANPLTQPQRDLIGTGLLLVAAAGFAAAGQRPLATGFAAVVVLGWLALIALGPSAVEALRPTAAIDR